MQLELENGIDFDGWRKQARWLAAHSIPAVDVHWRINGETSLLDDAAHHSGPAKRPAACSSEAR